MSFKLPEHMAIDLLNRLGSDDGFRSVFAADPRKALSEIGFGPASDPSVLEGVWKCMNVDTLASKAVILASRDALVRQFTAEKAGQHPISLEVQASKLFQAA